MKKTSQLTAYEVRCIIAEKFGVDPKYVEIKTKKINIRIPFIRQKPAFRVTIEEEERTV